MRRNIPSVFYCFLAISSDRHTWPVLAKSITDFENQIKRRYHQEHFTEVKIDQSVTEGSLLVFVYEEQYICWIIRQRKDLTIEPDDYINTFAQAQDLKTKLQGGEDL